MTAKSFFKKVGRNIQSASGALTKEAGKAAGAVLGKAAATYAMEAAPALLAFKTGGRVPGKKGKAIKIVAHSGEYILPLNVKPTKAQKAVVRKNKLKKK
jgi:hypothetical protein